MEFDDTGLSLYTQSTNSGLNNHVGLRIYKGKKDTSNPEENLVFYADSEGDLHLTGTITAKDGSFNGTVTANKGEIGGFEINGGILTSTDE
jgi:hypothetical protein